MGLLQGLRLSFPAYPLAQLFSYASGTSTKQDVFTTSGLSVPHDNPLSADANGLFPSIFRDPSKSYKFVLAPSTDADPPANPIFTVDDVSEPTAGELSVIFLTTSGSVTLSDGTDVLVLADATLGSFSIALYTAVGNEGRTIRVIKVDASANTVTVDPAGSQTINGSASITITQQYDTVQIASDGSNWLRLTPSLLTPGVLAKSANYTVTTADGADVLVAMNATGGARTVTLYPAAGNTGRRVEVKKTDSSANAVTIDGNASETIDGAATKVLSTQYDSAVLECDGSNWHVIAASGILPGVTHNTSRLTQLAFAATQVPSADVNTLDDYEEGAWTPVLGGDGGTSGQTYTSQHGEYAKIGKLVFVSGTITLSAKGTITGGLIISGLPFAPQASHDSAAAFGDWDDGAANSVWVAGILGSAGVIALRNKDSASLTMSPMDTNDVANDTACEFFMMYLAAA